MYCNVHFYGGIAVKKISNTLKNIFCAVITINLIFTSTQCVYADATDHNGIKFEKANVNLNDIAYNGKSTYVSVGAKGEIEISNDGIHIKPVKVNGINCNLTKIKWTGTQFIVIGDKGTILTSKDGYKWTKGKGISTKSIKINSVINNRNTIVLVGNNGKIYRSTNGINFSLVKSNTTQSLNDIIRTTTEFVAVGNKGTIVISKDGKTWSKIKSGVTNNLVDISWNGKKYVVVGGDAILSSSDSKKWSVKHFNDKSENINVNLKKIAWNNKEIIVGGTDITYADENHEYPKSSFIFYNSTDAVNWDSHIVLHYVDGPLGFYTTNPELVSVDLLDIIPANGKFIVLGHDVKNDPAENLFDGTPLLIGYISEENNHLNPTSSMYYEDWSINYYESTTDKKWGSFDEETIRKALWDGKSVTIVGDTILRYNDINGKSYIRKGKPVDQISSMVVYNGTKYIDFDNSLYSYDSKHWIYDDNYSKKISINNTPMRILVSCDDSVFWTGKAFITVAESEDYGNFYDTIVYSYDGKKWYDANLHARLFNAGGCYLSKQNDNYIANVERINYTSSDGINWTKQQ